jgi:Uma2 family endonuclease
MSLPKSDPVCTEEEYLALEREAEERHEYLDGQIYLMAGESFAHGYICVNLVRELSLQLRGDPCGVFSKDMKVRSGPVPKSRYATKGLYSYPDILVVCGEPQVLDEFRDVLLNPKVIIEVLSPSTEGFDRGEKFLRYRTHLESLTDYIVVAQDYPLVEHFSRQPEGKWLMRPAADLADSIAITSIDCTLRLSDVYDRVVFPPPPEEESDEELPPPVS